MSENVVLVCRKTLSERCQASLVFLSLKGRSVLGFDSSSGVSHFPEDQANKNPVQESGNQGSFDLLGSQ